MLAFHPYGPQDIRVVSDLSRFDFDSATPRNRSRNTTPTDHRSESILNIHNDPTQYNPPRQILEHDELGKTTKLYSNRSAKKTDDYEPQNEIYQYYMKSNKTNDNISEFTPYPPSVYDESKLNDHLPYNSPGRPEFTIPSIPPQDNIVPPPPPKSPPQNKIYQPQPNSPSRVNMGESIPVMPQPRDVIVEPPLEEQLPPQETPQKNKKRWRRRRKHNGEKYLDGASIDDENTSMTSKQKEMEVVLIKSVMNRPLFSIKLKNIYSDPGLGEESVKVTAQWAIYIFEIISAVIVISLSGILLSTDKDIGKGIYRYFIADQIISMITAFLFLSSIVNFEKRNGSFYCTAACLLTLVSFIMVNSTVLVQSKCPSKSVCAMRKAASAFIIISTFVWMTDLVMFLTTLYISRLNLLNDINFDYSNSGTNDNFVNKTLHNRPQNFDPTIDPSTGRPWPQYYMKADGEIVRYDGSFNPTGIERLIVYLPYQ